MESVPVLDIEVDPRAGRRASPAAYSPLAGVALLALAWPWTFGLPLALPLLFVGLGAMAVRAADGSTFGLSIVDDRLVVRHEHGVACTPLANVAQVVESPDAITLSLPTGSLIIPLSSLGGDPRRLLDQIPAHVARAQAPPSAASLRSTLTLGWGLVALLALILFVSRPR